ncbi:ABC transporter substrate-binding protein [Patescibacteria group bacterium]
MKARTVLIPLFILAVPVAAVWFLLSAVGGTERFDRNELVRVQLSDIHQARFAGFYAAEQLGFYDDEGIDVKLNPGGPDINQVDALSIGDADFAVPSGFETISAVGAGRRLKAVVAVHAATPIVYLARSDAGIDSLENFYGKTIGVSRPEHSLLYRKMMENKGLDWTNVRETDGSACLQGLLDGDYDILAGDALMALQDAQDRGMDIVSFRPVDYGISAFGDVVVAANRMLDDRPELTRRFLRATVRGWEHVYSHPDTAPGFVQAYNPTANPPQEKAQMYASRSFLVTEGRHFGHMDSPSWDAMVSLVRQHGTVADPPEINDLYVTDFMPVHYRHYIR